MPAQGREASRQGCLHARFEGVDAGACGTVGGLGVLSGTQVCKGHGGELPFDLVEDQQAVGQHPAAVGGRCRSTGVHRHRGLDPVDQFVAPEAEQLAHRGQVVEGATAQRCQTLLQQVERVAPEGFAAPIAPAPLALLAAAGEDPEGIAHHKTPTAETFTALDRFEQHPMGTGGTHLQPGAQWCFEVGRPAAAQGDERAPRCQLLLKVLIVGRRAAWGAGRAGHGASDGQKKRGQRPRLYRSWPVWLRRRRCSCR